MRTISIIQRIERKYNKKSYNGLSLGLRVFLFLLLLVVTMIIGVFFILTINGTFRSGLYEPVQSVDKELTAMSEQVTKQYGLCSVHTVELSKSLSKSIENQLYDMELTTKDLKSHPEVLEKIVSAQYDKLFLSLQTSSASGVFVILDATVNPKLVNSQNSKSGLYIKNMAPNIVNSASPSILITRGFSSIGRNGSIPLHSEWEMEFDIENAPYYTKPMDSGENSSLPLSRLYYWTPPTKLPHSSEKIMLCSVPLIDSKGNVFGVCGLEINAMLFKLENMPDNTSYKRIFSTLSPIKDSSLETSQAFFAGGYSAKTITQENKNLSFKSNGDDFYSYTTVNGISFSGMHKIITLYPSDSVFKDEKWATAVMMPESDIVAIEVANNIKIAMVLFVLLLLGIVFSVLLSKRYIKPIKKSIEHIKANSFDSTIKTNITEIDDLMEFLVTSIGENSAQNGQEIKAQINLPSSIFAEFQKNSDTLSPAERAVFDLYLEGHTAKEITEILCLSINTIKTHNKRIYMKLNVASRQELLVYVNMLRESGAELKR